MDSDINTFKHLASLLNKGMNNYMNPAYLVMKRLALCIIPW